MHTDLAAVFRAKIGTVARWCQLVQTSCCKNTIYIRQSFC